MRLIALQRCLLSLGTNKVTTLNRSPNKRIYKGEWKQGDARGLAAVWTPNYIMIACCYPVPMAAPIMAIRVKTAASKNIHLYNSGIMV